MKASTKRLVLIVMASVLLTLAVLRFIFGGIGPFSLVLGCLMIVVALCGIFGAWKLNQTALLVFFIAMVVLFVLDIVQLLVLLANHRWKYQADVTWIIVELVFYLVAAVLAHSLRHGTVLIRI